MNLTLRFYFSVCYNRSCNYCGCGFLPSSHKRMQSRNICFPVLCCVIRSRALHGYKCKYIKTDHCFVVDVLTTWHNTIWLEFSVIYFVFIILYTLPKEMRLFQAAFLLEKCVCQWISSDSRVPYLLYTLIGFYGEPDLKVSFWKECKAKEWPTQSMNTIDQEFCCKL